MLLFHLNSSPLTAPAIAFVILPLTVGLTRKVDKPKSVTVIYNKNCI